MGGIQFGIYSLPDTIAEINGLVTEISTGLTDLEGNLLSSLNTVMRPSDDLLHDSGLVELLYQEGVVNKSLGAFYVPFTGIYKVSAELTIYGGGSLEVNYLAQDVYSVVDESNLVNLPAGTAVATIGKAGLQIVRKTASVGVATAWAHLQKGSAIIAYITAGGNYFLTGKYSVYGKEVVM